MTKSCLLRVFRYVSAYIWLDEIWRFGRISMEIAKKQGVLAVGKSMFRGSLFV